MKMRKNGRNTIWVHAQILQNGYPVASSQKKVHSRGGMSLTNGRRGDLRIPLYSENLHFQFIKFVRGVVSFSLDLPWDGQLSSCGLVHEVDHGTDRNETYTLEPGDYVSLAHGDLRLLVQVLDRPFVQPVARTVKMISGYKQSLLFLFIEDRAVFAAGGIGILAALILVGSFAIGLATRPKLPPGKFEELESTYVLPFIDPEHMRLAPESLQESLNVRSYLPSVLIQYSSFSDMLSGLAPPKEGYVFQSSKERFDRVHSLQRELDEQHEKTMANLGEQSRLRPNSAVILMPMVFGENGQSTITRVVKQFTVHHEALKELVAARRGSIVAFAKDAEYDYKEYKKAPKGNEKAQEALKKIKVWNVPTEEEAVYLEGNRLANEATILGRAYRQLIDERGAHDPHLPAIEIESVSASFSGRQVFDERPDNKWAVVRGAEFGKKVTKLVREPLIGEIEPHLVERTIKTNQFDLQLCFETALRRNQLTEGIMEWKWRIDTRGTIEDLTLMTSTIKDPRMIKCVKQKISTWQFPRPRRGSVEIIYPFEFKPARG